MIVSQGIYTPNELLGLEQVHVIHRHIKGLYFVTGSVVAIFVPVSWIEWGSKVEYSLLPDLRFDGLMDGYSL